MVNNRRDIHERVLAAKSPDELAAIYADWADHYDADVVGEMGYQAPFVAAQLLHSYLVSKSIRILDAGCGTGLVGQELFGLGYDQLVGLDYSTDMLEHAKRKRVYQQLIKGDLTKALDLEDGSFGAVICVGAFTLGHVGPEALTELLRIARAGAVICFTVREEVWARGKFEMAIDRLRDAQTLEVVEARLIPYIEEDASSCHICVVRAI